MDHSSINLDSCRDNYFDFLKGLLMFLVVYGHVQSSIFQRKHYWPFIRNDIGICHFTTNAKPWCAYDTHLVADKYRSFSAGMGLPAGMESLNPIGKIRKIKRWICRYSYCKLMLNFYFLFKNI